MLGAGCALNSRGNLALIVSDSVELIIAATKTKEHKLLAVALRVAINYAHNSSKHITVAHSYLKEMNACLESLDF